MPTDHSATTRSALTRAFLVETLRPFRWVIAVIVALSVAASLFDGLSIAVLVPLLAQLQQPGASGRAFGVGILRALVGEQSPRALVYWSILLVLFTSVLKNLFTALAIKIGHWLSTMLLADLRLKAATTLLRSGLGFHHRSRLGDLMDRTMTGTMTAEGLVRIAIEFTACMVTFLVLVGVLFVLSWQLTVIAVPMAALFAWWMRHHSRRLRAMSTAVADTNRSVAAMIYEALAGITLIKSYSQEERHLARLRETVEISRRIESRRRFQMFWIHPATDLAGTFAISLLVIVALQAEGAGTPFVLVRLLPFLFVLLRLVPLLKIVNNQRAELVSHWAQLGMLADLLHPDDKGFLRDGTRRFARLIDGIELRDVTVIYDGETQPALERVSFRIPARQTTAIIGASGAGKSTVAA